VPRLIFEALTSWPYPVVDIASAPFRAKWTDTRKLLLHELDQLDVDVAVVELDLAPGDLRQDGEIRANARPRSGRVRLSFTSRHGPLQYASDRYDGTYNGLQPWQSNARAIALTLQALRAVDRYGALRGGEQYAGFRALAAAPAPAFIDIDSAFRWTAAQAGQPLDQTTPRRAYRSAARRLHPDAGGDPAEWARLDEARQLLAAAGVL
jgi:hypothetical protein